MDFSLHKIIKGLVKVWIYPEELYTQPLTSVITLTLIVFLLSSQQPLEVLIQKSAQGLLVVQWLRLYLPLQLGLGSIPGQGTKIPHAWCPRNWNIKQIQYCNKFNKGLKKNGPHYTHQKKKKSQLRPVLKEKKGQKQA